MYIMAILLHIITLYMITGGNKMIELYPEGKLIDSFENCVATSSQSNLNDAYHEKKILEARATVCYGNHNLIVDLGCMKGIIPREEGAIGIREGTVRDIAIISKVNRPVCFVVTGFKKMMMVILLLYCLGEWLKKCVQKIIYQHLSQEM